MPFTVTKHLIIAALLVACNSAVSANDKPPRFLQEPVLGLRLKSAGVKLELLPEDVRKICVQIADSENWTARKWIFARAADAASTYYVVSGYSKRRHPEPGEPLYEPDERGGMLFVTGNKCEGDPAREVFKARDFNDTPQAILQQLAQDLAKRLSRAFGGPDRLRTEIKNQRIDFDQLSPELQEAFKPYFGPAK
ncbi:hypothetical protein [Massilia horti]|uniref:Secreted protein n=1 Tax=Massilia horti TaxID=2562153 RepID=A0A4Y9T8V7_9BURK|nr:hypothetical protein [Massilia horti]TFW34420.1 hypothetical protein E4O92_04250 [Massilia horti]